MPDIATQRQIRPRPCHPGDFSPAKEMQKVWKTILGWKSMEVQWNWKDEIIDSFNEGRVKTVHWQMTLEKLVIIFQGEGGDAERKREGYF